MKEHHKKLVKPLPSFLFLTTRNSKLRWEGEGGGGAGNEATS